MLKLLILSFLALTLKPVDSAREVHASDLVRETLVKRSLDEARSSLTYLLQLTPDEELVAERSLTTVSGVTKTRYHETYKGVPIYNAIITSDDEGHDVSGKLVKDISNDVNDVTPRITANEAVLIAMTAEGDDQIRDLTVDVQEKQQFIYLDSAKRARLVYHVTYLVELEEKVSRPFYIIDALNGDIIDHWQGLDANHALAGEGGNQKTKKYFYGSTYGHLRVTADASGTTCTYNNVNVEVEHMQSKTSSSGSPYSVPCSVGAKDEANGAYSPVNDAMYFGGVVFDMYKNWYNKSPLKTKLYMRVHYGTNYQNAFWNGRQMTFGDGASYFYPLVSLDVTAHEVSHGFTGQNSGLEYRSQSGGMNEAFSDMAGEAAKNYMKKSNDYRVGFDIVKSSSGALRYMANPPQDGRSIDHFSKYTEGIDVHYSSGIYNKAFYLLSTKSGWTTRKAFEIMVIANSMYWTRQSTFNEGACGVEKAAADKGYNLQDVKSAFSAVGVSCSGGSTSVGHKRVIVCEHGSTKTISCSSGNVIYIIGANYGRLENKCASSSVTNCVAYGSTSKTRTRCDGKSSCSLAATNSIYGDPCSGVGKFLDVKYACLPSGSIERTVCERTAATITCPNGKTLDISYANYGRLDPETCTNKYKNINCAASGVSGKVKTRCNGKSSCYLYSSNSLYGDPCAGIEKYLTVKYRCI